MIDLEKGYIGCLEMLDQESGTRQLEAYVSELKNRGHQQIIAPINGSTWYPYRLMSWTSGEQPFPLEPQNPLWYNQVYEGCGFKPFKKYRSDQFSIENIKPVVGTAVRMRPFCASDLPLIYDLSLKGFRDNFLYSEITFEEFSRLYQPILPMVDPELVVIAEINQQPVGFMFAFAVSKRLILKTMAVLPEFRSHGIGGQLINQVLVAGQKKGLTKAIAALMADDNHSHKIVSKYGSEKIREYTLYCLEV